MARCFVSKSLILAWFGLCLFLFVMVTHPFVAERNLPLMNEWVKRVHQTLAPFFFRPTVY